MPPAGALGQCEKSLFKRWLGKQPPPPPPCNLEELSYETTVVPLVQENCISCHGKDSTLNLSEFHDYRDSRSTRERWLLAQKHVSNGTMPPGKPLDRCSQERLEKWVKLGLPNAVPKCDLEDVTYEKSIAPLIEANCVSCHGPSARLDLTTFHDADDTRSTKERWSLVAKLVASDSMPPERPLDQCSKQKIESWVAAGLPSADPRTEDVL